jgi:NADH-quinone oxidoreductase subunit E
MSSVSAHTPAGDGHVSGIVNKYDAQTAALIMVLQDVQKTFRYLPEGAMREIAHLMHVPVARVYSVATFYRAFSLKPKGRHHICVCTGTACHVRGSRLIVEKLQRDLKIKPGETTPDREYSLETVNCLGACALGPLVTANDEYFGNLTNAGVDRMMKRLQRHDAEHTPATGAA